MISVAPSGVHGLGAFAQRDVTEGERVGTYAGRRYTASQVRRRNWDTSLTYVFGLSDGSVIDAAQGGNETLHLNHSCEPNCVAYEERLETGRWGITFYAVRAISAGEELTLDYCLATEDAAQPDSFACSCGAPACRGSMLAQVTPD